MASLNDMKKVIKGEYKFGGHKLYYEHRLFLLNDLPKRSVGAEIGVYAGKFAKKMIQIVQPKELFLIDPWDNDHIYLCFLQTHLHYIKKYGENITTLKKTIEEAYYCKDIQDNYFDWVYLDTDHKLESTRRQLKICRKIVKSGGLICGDDYDQKNWPHVIQAVEEFVKNNDLTAETKNRQFWIKNE